MFERLLIVWLTLLALAAYYWPELCSSIFGDSAVDPFVATQPVLWYLIAAIMFVIGGLLPRDEIRQVASRWPTVLLGTAIQYGSMPLLAYSFAELCGLEGDLRVGVIMVGCVPGAMASNVLTLMARGNVSYSVSLTTCATLLSPLVVPAVLWMALARSVKFPVAATSLELLLYVVLPVVAGHVASRRLPRFESFLQRWGPTLANLVILWLIAVVVGLNRERLAILAEDSENAAIEARLLVALVGINIFGYLAGYFGATLLRMPWPMRRALSIEVGMQNAGLGSTLALSLFPDHPATAVPTALYTFGCMFTGTLLARAWAEYDRWRGRAANDASAI